jgi:hypothetical protein
MLKRKVSPIRLEFSASSFVEQLLSLIRRATNPLIWQHLLAIHKVLRSLGTLHITTGPWTREFNLLYRVSSAVVQRYLPQILEAALIRNPALQNAAVDILGFTIKQGLAHPLQASWPLYYGWYLHKSTVSTCHYCPGDD